MCARLCDANFGQYRLFKALEASGVLRLGPVRIRQKATCSNNVLPTAMMHGFHDLTESTVVFAAQPSFPLPNEKSVGANEEPRSRICWLPGPSHRREVTITVKRK